MRRFELIIKELAQPRLTITKERITLKVPPTFKGDIETLKQFAHKKADELGPVHNTYRKGLRNE